MLGLCPDFEYADAEVDLPAAFARKSIEQDLMLRHVNQAAFEASSRPSRVRRGPSEPDFQASLNARVSKSATSSTGAFAAR